MHLRAFIVTVLITYAPLTYAVSSVENTIDIRVNTGGNSAEPGERIETGNSSITLDLTTRVDGETVERVEERASSSVTYRSTTTVAAGTTTLERVLERDREPVLSDVRRTPTLQAEEPATTSEPLPSTLSTANASSASNSTVANEPTLVARIVTDVFEAVIRTAKHVYALFT